MLLSRLVSFRCVCRGFIPAGLKTFVTLERLLKQRPVPITQAMGRYMPIINGRVTRTKIIPASVRKKMTMKPMLITIRIWRFAITIQVITIAKVANKMGSSRIASRMLPSCLVSTIDAPNAIKQQS